MSQGTIGETIKVIIGTAKADFLVPDTTGFENPFSYRVFGNAGNDTLIGATHNDTLLGDQGDDRLIGNEGNDILYGGLGADVLRGGKGNDVLYAGPESNGADTLFGGGGNDTLFFGNRAILTGGQGADTFVFRDGADESQITDFQHGVDKISLALVGVHSFQELTIIPALPGSGLQNSVAVFFKSAEQGAVVPHAFIVDNQAHAVGLDASDFIFATV